jgi:hypothetical protein
MTPQEELKVSYRDVDKVLHEVTLSPGGGSGDMTRAVYDPNMDGVIALSQLDGDVSTFKQSNHDGLPDPHHPHANKALLDTYAQTEADLADAISKKHPAAHSHPETEVVNLVTDLAAKETPAGAQTKIDTHAALTTGVHGVGAGTVAKTSDITKDAVGLGNVDNTSDAGKPVSTAQQTALDGKVSHSLATAVSDFLVASGVGAFVKKTLAEVKTILGLGTAAYTASTDYAVAAKGVTNGDTHDHVGGDGGQIDHVNLANKGTNTHAQVDTFVASKAAASGLASLDASSKVVQEPASKGAASGIAPLDTGSKVPTVNLGGAGASGSNFLRGDQTWATPAGGGGAWTTAVKNADQTNNTATLVDDTVLQFNTVAFTQYTIRLIAFGLTNATADFKYRLVHTGTTTRVRRRVKRTATTDIAQTIELKTAFDAADVVLSTTGLNPWVEEDIILQVGASGGVVKFQWAQVTLNAGPTQCLEGSYLEYAAA